MQADGLRASLLVERREERSDGESGSMRIIRVRFEGAYELPIFDGILDAVLADDPL
jgi:hypothetical protein